MDQPGPLDSAAAVAGDYRPAGGIFRPPAPVAHRDDEYDSAGFDVLARMQGEHFWYRGRHRFLLRAVRRRLAADRRAGPPRVIDLGGGCGGWVSRLARDGHFEGAELALADSSERALRHAATILPGRVGLYQVDLMDLQWSGRWDLAFLLDVLEHIPDQEGALRQIHAALAPGGLLFVTVPALRAFWTWNDEAVHHLRRYSRADFRDLAGRVGFRLLDARYFMFFLSPLMLLSRWLTGKALPPDLTDEAKADLIAKTHRVPPRAINAALAAIFACETPLGHHIRFPWGTSLLAVLQKPPRPGEGDGPGDGRPATARRGGSPDVPR